jgi:hypothetical protein
MNPCFILDRYPHIRFSRSRWFTRGATRNPDIVITAVAMSSLPRVKVHCRAPMRDWYWCMPSSSSNSEVSSSGWSLLRSGDDVYTPLGFVPNIVSYCIIMRSMYFLGPIHMTPSSSRKKLFPRWKDTGPVPYNLNLLGWAVKATMMAFGSLDAIIRSST